MKRSHLFIVVALFLCACAMTQDGENCFDLLASAEFSSISRIHCQNRTSLSEETQTDFRVNVQQKKDNPFRVCYGLADGETCYETYRNYTYTECREITPPYKHCNDDRLDGNEVWKIYHTTAGDTLMLGNNIFVAITGEGCFVAKKR